jgi:hypothetical protein
LKHREYYPCYHREGVLSNLFVYVKATGWKMAWLGFEKWCSPEMKEKKTRLKNLPLPHATRPAHFMLCVTENIIQALDKLAD